jgi:hypothetical protein
MQTKTVRVVSSAETDINALHKLYKVSKPTLYGIATRRLIEEVKKTGTLFPKIKK